MAVKEMNLSKKVGDSLVISSIVLLSSLLIPIIPCRVSPAVPNPLFSWKFCTLNPDSAIPRTYLTEYFGYTQSLSDAFFMTVIFTFIASMILFHYAMPKRKRGERR